MGFGGASALLLGIMSVIACDENLVGLCGMSPFTGDGGERSLFEFAVGMMAGL